MDVLCYFGIPACLGYITSRAAFCGALDIAVVAVVAWILDLVYLCTGGRE